MFTIYTSYILQRGICIPYQVNQRKPEWWNDKLATLLDVDF